MESCHMCQSSLRLKLTPRNYKKWSASMLVHLREHQEVIPLLCSKIPPSFNYLHLLLHFMYNSMSKESFAPLLVASFLHDVWMALWEAYGYPNIPPFPNEILSFVASSSSNSKRDPTS